MKIKGNCVGRFYNGRAGTLTNYFFYLALLDRNLRPLVARLGTRTIFPEYSEISFRISLGAVRIIGCKVKRRL